MVNVGRLLTREQQTGREEELLTSAAGQQLIAEKAKIIKRQLINRKWRAAA